MKQFTAEDIQTQFEKLPREVQEAVTSTEVNDKIEVIAKKHNLLINQTGELVDEIGLVMLGLAKSGDFVDHIISRCSINKDDALDIAHEVNTEVFGAIKQHMMQMEEKSEIDSKPHGEDPNISDLERIGDFRILKEDDNSKNGNGFGTIGVENIQTDNLLKGPTVAIEKKVTAEIPPNLPVENNSSKTIQVEKTSPMVPPIIQKPQAPPQSEKPIINKPITTPPSPIPKKTYEKDPYREPF